MIDIEAIEQKLADLLAPLRSRQVLAMIQPNTVGEAGQQVGAGTVVVTLERIQSADHPSLDRRVQSRRYTVSCDIRLRQRQGPSGITQVAAEIEKLLHGQKLNGLGILDFSDFQRVGRSDAAWVYLMVFTCTAMDDRLRR